MYVQLVYNYIEIILKIIGGINVKLRRILTTLLTLVLLVTLCACGNSNAPADTGSEKTSAPAEDYDGSSFGIDLESAELQPMSEERATKEKLRETRDDYCEGLNFFDALKSRTYKDFVDYIGCDASEYQLYNGNRFYIWIAEDDDTANFNVLFSNESGAWKGKGVGAMNLGSK